MNSEVLNATPLSSVFFPQHQRQAAVHLNEWCEWIEEQTQGEATDLPEFLRQVQADTVRAFHDWTEADEPYRALGWTAEQFNISEDLALEIIQGIRQATLGPNPPDEDSLLRYCSRTGGNFCLMMGAVFGVRTASHRSAALQIGQASQLVKVARELGPELRGGRLLLPDSWLEAQGLSREDFWEFPFRRQPLIRQTLAKAEELFAQALPEMPKLPFRASLALSFTARLSQALGRKIQRNPKKQIHGLNFVERSICLFSGLSLSLRHRLELRPR